jgi:hypothetical protein
MRMRRSGWLAAGLVAVSGCGDAMTSRADVAARAGSYELGVDQLAEVLANGKGLRLEVEVAEGIATLWADYTIFADRLLAGDSLTDSGYVAAAMWAEMQQEFADRYHERLVANQVVMDSAAVDSVYAAGELRWIRQILFGVSPNASPGERDARRRMAHDTRAQLQSGAVTWAAAVESTDDPSPRDSAGAVGLIARGETLAPFENAAFALEPDSMSPVIESARGYHILWRPPLTAVRERFAREVELRREMAFDDAFLAALPERWNIAVRRGIAPAVRELGANAVRAKQSGKVLGSYRGGRFRVSDLARWLQAMPVQVRQQLGTASDSQVVTLVESLIRNQALVQEARDSGVTLPAEFHEEMTDQLRRQIALVSALIGFPLDTLPALRTLPAEARRDSVRTRVSAYLDAVAQEGKRLQAVPPFLADTLRAETDWRLVAAGIEAALGRARQIRLQQSPGAPPGNAPPVEPDAR